MKQASGSDTGQLADDDAAAHGEYNGSRYEC